MTTATIDETKLNSIIGQAVGDFGGAGFRSFRRATATPTNRVFEAKP